MNSFSLFSSLPAEIRLEIWSLVPQPTRFIGLLPSVEAGHNRRRNRHRQVNRTEHQFRYVVQPRSSAVFAPLHACRESRDVWLRKLFQTPRHFVVPLPDNYESDNNSNSPAGYSVQFCMPFLNYAADIFTVFDAWRLPDFAGLPGYPQPHDPNDDAYVDPFVGLDRSQIQLIGLCEIPQGLEGAFQAMHVLTLPKLQGLSFLTLGPESSSSRLDEDHEQREMSVHHMEKVDCEFRDIAPDKVDTSGFLNDSRLRHQYSMSPAIRPLPQYAAYVKSLLWHIYSGSEKAGLDDWMTHERIRGFMSYVREGHDDAICPWCNHHTKDELVKWIPDFDMNYKILCATDMLPSLLEEGVI